jgi:hypothetical protein
MNTRHAANFANLSPPLIRLIVVCFSFPLAPQPPTTRSTLFGGSCVVDCCVLGQVHPWFASNRLPLQSNIVVSCRPPFPPNSWLLYPPVDPRPLDLPFNRFERVRGQLFHWSPLPSTSCAEEKPQPAIAPSLRCRGGCFISPTAKLTASRATEAREGIGDGVGWLWWP